MSIIQLKNGNIASASNNKIIKIWVIYSLKCIQEITGHQNNMLSIKYKNIKSNQEEQKKTRTIRREKSKLP